MKGVDCKLPIQEDFRNFLNNRKIDSSLKYKKILIFAGLFLLVAMSILIGFTFRALTEISELKQEVEYLKSSLQTLQKVAIFPDKYDDLEYTEDTTETDYNDDYYDISYGDDYKSEDYYKDNDEIANSLKPVLAGGDFTKDAKQATVPPRIKRNIGFEEDRRKNLTSKKNHFSTEAPPSSYSYPLYPRLVHQVDTYQPTSSPKSVHTKRTRLLKKTNFLKSGDLQYSGENPDVEFTVVGDDQIGLKRTRHRQRRLELDETPVRTGRMRPLPTAHFNGDTSKYVLGQHDNFDGNGRLRHPRRTFVDWTESSWFHTLGMDRHFSLSDGVLTIKESGLYFIYAQIYYLDVHDTNGFRVYRNGSHTLLQCTTMTHSVDRVTKGNTCYTAAAEYLHENDRISLGDLSDSRYSLFEPGKSFFGVIKLGDVKIK